MVIQSKVFGFPPGTPQTNPNITVNSHNPHSSDFLSPIRNLANGPQNASRSNGLVCQKMSRGRRCSFQPKTPVSLPAPNCPLMAAFRGADFPKHSIFRQIRIC